MTPFCFEHDFRAASVADVFAAYFDPGHQREQDDAVEIASREIRETTDDGLVLRRVSHVIPQRQLPAVIRPFVAGGKLSYIETIVWRRRDDVIDMSIRPSILGGRAHIEATYRLTRAASGLVHRRYAGEVRVELALIAGRVERGIVAEFARTLPVAASVTQGWLDRQIVTISARA